VVEVISCYLLYGGRCSMLSHHDYWDLLVAMAFRAQDAICTNWAPEAQQLLFVSCLLTSQEKDLPNLRCTPVQPGATSVHVHSRDSGWSSEASEVERSPRDDQHSLAPYDGSTDYRRLLVGLGTFGGNDKDNASPHGTAWLHASQLQAAPNPTRE